MDQMSPMTPEAKKLNDPPYERDHAQQLREVEHRRALTALLPPGKVLDQAMLDMITRGAQTWAPFTVLRQMLAEAGARTIGTGMILSAAEVQALEDQLHREPHATSLGEYGARAAAAGTPGAG